MLILFSLAPLRYLAKPLATAWHALTDSLFDPYKPELHYMRGPGPKCRAKRQGRSENRVR
jgi:hypothetical protein